MTWIYSVAFRRAWHRARPATTEARATPKLAMRNPRCGHACPYSARSRLRNVKLMISRLAAQPRRARRVTVPITGLAVLLAGACTPVAENPWASGPAGGSHTSVASPTAVATPPSEGVTARPVSTANALEGRHLRLVRLGTDDLVLQSDMVNTGTLPAGPGTLAYVTTPPLRVADLPRGTDYEVQTEVKESPFNAETRINP